MPDAVCKKGGRPCLRCDNFLAMSRPSRPPSSDPDGVSSQPAHRGLSKSADGVSTVSRSDL